MHQRFYLIEGKADCLAPDPTSTARAYLGQDRVEAPHGASHVDRFKPCRQLVAGAHIERAVKKGDVVCLAVVSAESREEAERLVAAKSAPATKTKPATSAA